MVVRLDNVSVVRVAKVIEKHPNVGKVFRRWKLFAIRLHIRADDICDLEVKVRFGEWDQGEVLGGILLSWIAVKGNSATLEELMNALFDIGCPDVADTLAKDFRRQESLQFGADILKMSTILKILKECFDLNKLAQKWTILANELGLEHQFKADLKLQYHMGHMQDSDMLRAVLRFWMIQEKLQATLPKLLDACLRLSRRDMAGESEIEVDENSIVDQDEIKFDENSAPIGKGGVGVVFKGYYGSQIAAIKRIQDVIEDKEKERVEKEVKALINCNHLNIVRYFQMRKESKGSLATFLIAMEYCEITLKEWVEQKNFSDEKLGEVTKNITSVDIIRGITSGLHHLHNMKARIIHRDLKPDNIFLRNIHGEVVVKVGDFGLSGFIMDGNTHVTVYTRAGTRQWMPPEILKYMDANEETLKLTVEADIYPLGCLFYYVLTNGKHPFRVAPTAPSIYKPELNLEHLQDGTPYYNCLHLIKRMISYKPKDRPSTEDILSHHIFWDYGKKLLFLNEISDYFVKEDSQKMAKFLKRFAEYLLPFFNYTRFKEIFESEAGWYGYLSENVQLGLINKKAKCSRKYDGKSVIHLLDAIRNLKAHYSEKNELVREEVGKIPDEYFNYWHAEDRFPFLLDLVWTSFLNYSKKVTVKDDESLKSLVQYYYSGIKFDFSKISNEHIPD